MGVLLSGLHAPPVAADADGKVDWKTWRKIEKRFQSRLKEALDPEAETTDFVEAARAVVADSEPRAHKSLVAALKSLLEAQDKARAQVDKQVAGIVKGRWEKKIHTALEGMRAAARRSQTLMDQAADVIGKGDPAAHDALALTAVKSEDVRWKAIVARVYAHTPKRDAAIRWLGSMSVSKDRDTRAVVLQALTTQALSWPRLISQRIRDSDWAIRALAARTIATHKNKMAIGELIGALSCASPRVQGALLDTLEALTGKDYGLNLRGWQVWWEEQRRRRAFGPQTSSGVGPTCGRRSYATFYDLELQSSRLMFVIDVSASMEQAAVKGGDYTRLELMKRQLTRTLKRLTNGIEFGIVAFGARIRPWQKGLTKMDAGTRRQAIRWIQSLRPTGGSGTYMNGALHHVFQQVGFADIGRGEMPVDTIVLLSDGAPTDGWPGARGKAGRQAVLETLRAWNRDRLLVIHTVALGGHAKGFLAAVAAEHGGKATVR